MPKRTNRTCANIACRRPGSCSWRHPIVCLELEVDILDFSHRVWSQSDCDHLVSVRTSLASLLQSHCANPVYSFLPETLRSIVGDGSLAKPWYNRRPQEALKLREEAKNRFGKGVLPTKKDSTLQRKKVITSRLVYLGLHS